MFEIELIHAGDFAMSRAVIKTAARSREKATIWNLYNCADSNVFCVRMDG
jgi:hypothetical protein